MGERIVAAALHRSGRVLLGHRSPHRRFYPDVWDFPGGHVEAGEQHLDALRRELVEEIGVTSLRVDPVPLLRWRPAPDAELTVWAVDCWRGCPRNCQPAEHDAIGWFTAAQLAGLRLADPSYREPLTRLLTG